MHVELVGCTSAGKSTLAAAMADAAREERIVLVLGSDLILGMLGFSGTRNRWLRAVAIHIVAAVGCLRRTWKCTKFMTFSRGVLRRMPISRGQRANQLRKVLKQLGCYEFMALGSKQPAVTLVDEGTVHAAHNLFVHVDGTLDHREVETFAELVPLPDVVIYVRDSEKVIVERTLARWHPRIPRSASNETVSAFVHKAIETFDLLSVHERIAERTVVVDGCNIIPPSGQPHDARTEAVLRILERAIRAGNTQPRQFVGPIA